MKAVVFNEYGSPDVLQLVDAEKPAPKEGEVLVRIRAAAANPLDWHRMRGAPFLVRLTDGLSKPKNPRLGADIAGDVEAVGAGVTQFRPGDAVFGEIGAGGFAHYAAVRQALLAPKPANLAYDAAAAVPVAALTALQSLRDHGKLQPGQRVLVNGASGGVGTFAVQIAKALGAEVTGVCSTRNLEMVRALGADAVVDYTQENFTRTGQTYDLILDAVGNHSVADYRRSLNPAGICVVAGFTTLPRMFQVMLWGAWISKISGQTIGSMLAKASRQDLAVLTELIEADKVTPVIDRRYALGETAEAIRYLETGRARGKVVITMAHEDS